MNDEITQLQSQLDCFAHELRAAKRTIQKLERGESWRGRILYLLGVLALSGVALNGVTTHSRAEAVLPQGQTLAAPFAIHGKDGKMLFAVSEDAGGFGKMYLAGREQNVAVEVSGNGSLKINREDGTPAVQMVASNDGADFTIQSATKEQQIHLTSWSGGAAIMVQKSPDTSAMIEANDKRLGFSARAQGKDKAFLGAAEAGGSLKVFGDTDKPIATLESDAGDGKFWVYDKGGQQVAGVFARDNGGVVKVMKSGDANTYTAINAIDAGLGVMVRKAGVKKAFMGTSGEGNDKGSVYVYTTGDDPVAGLTSYGGGKGLVAVFSKVAAIAMLAESDKHAGAGSITATDPAGNGVFSAGFTGEGGDVCVNRKSGLKCLGVGLPLQIQP